MPALRPEPNTWIREGARLHLAKIAAAEDDQSSHRSLPSGATCCVDLTRVSASPDGDLDNLGRIAYGCAVVADLIPETC